MDSNTDALTRMFRSLTIEDIQEAQEIDARPEANLDPHFLLLGRTTAGKSALAGKITGGRIQSSSGPTDRTSINDSPGPGEWKYIKTELMEEPNTGQGYYVHDTVGLGDVRVDLGEMKREVNAFCVQNDSCCVFLCLSWDESIYSQDTSTTFEVCNSLNKWEDVIFVITKCDLAHQSASNVDDTFEIDWENAIRDKLIRDMRIDEDVARNIATNQIVFSGHPQFRFSLLDALRNIIQEGLPRARMKYLSLGKALFSLETILEVMELQRQHSESDISMITEPNENLDSYENIAPIENIVPIENVTEAEDSGIRRRRHGEHSQNSSTSPFSPPSPTSFMDTSSLSSRVSCLSPSYQHVRRSPPPYVADLPPPPYEADLPPPLDPPESGLPSAETVVKGIVATLGCTAAGVGTGYLLATVAGVSIVAAIGGGAAVAISLGTLAVLYFAGKLSS